MYETISYLHFICRSIAFMLPQGSVRRYTRKIKLLKTSNSLLLTIH